MMAATTDQQLSLAVAPRGNSSHLNKQARQLVPAFLQKLYEMVNDPANQDLIRWSDAGDSFLVLDQERFASEVLGRWFKHNRFTTFVRQLNMYGFHKIPHLQQGVLRSGSETEFWNYEHPHFLRGQPDLLCLIQRKKPAGADDAHAAPAATQDVAASGTVGALSTNQVLDINAIVNGIQAVKRHQATISADLNELKSSNQLLWQEAMAARERHKKHQDTINRILKFLAGVFGHGNNQMRQDDDASHAVVARKPQRLLIADGRSGQNADANEAAEEEPRTSIESARSTNSTDFFASLDTPSAQPSEPFTTPRFASVEPGVTDAPTPAATESPRQARSAPVVPLSSTTATSVPSQANNDHIVQTTLASSPNSQAPMQKLLAALAAQSISPEVFSSTGLPQPYQQQPLIAQSPYNNSSSLYIPNINSASGTIQPTVATSSRLPTTFDYTAANALSPFSFSLLGNPSELDSSFALQQQDDRLQKTYKTTAEINGDVDELQSNIQSLIQSLGIDASALDSVLPPAETVSSMSGGGSSAPPLSAGDMDIFAPVNTGASQDFDFDSFLMDMPRTDEGDGDLDELAERLDPSARMPQVSDSSARGSASSAQLHAFLGEVASHDTSEGIPALKIPAGATGGAQGMGTEAGVRGRKRKSDVVADAVGSEAPKASLSLTGSKSKRKR